ncbi:hypothetical protein GGI00_003416, partial [Coemansia sp. RSA 2681]
MGTKACKAATMEDMVAATTADMAVVIMEEGMAAKAIMEEAIVDTAVVVAITAEDMVEEAIMEDMAEDMVEEAIMEDTEEDIITTAEVGATMAASIRTMAKAVGRT